MEGNSRRRRQETPRTVNARILAMEVHERGHFEGECSAINSERDKEGAQRVVLWAQGGACLGGGHDVQMFVVKAQSKRH